MFLHAPRTPLIAGGQQAIKSLVALAVLAVSIALIAQTADNNSFEGTWKLNVAKSKYEPGPTPKSVTVTVASDGKTSLEGISSKGQPYSWSYTPEQGKAVPVDGVPGLTITRESQTRGQLYRFLEGA